MISLNLNAVRAKQTESDEIAAAMADFRTPSGGNYQELPTARMKPKPLRSKNNP